MKKLYDAINNVVENPDLSDEVAEDSAVVMREELKNILQGLLSHDDDGDLRQAIKNITHKL